MRGSRPGRAMADSEARRPFTADVRREIRQSVSALLLFSGLLFESSRITRSRRRFDGPLFLIFTEHPLVGGTPAGGRVVSPVMVFLHDIYFYHHASVDAPPSAVQSGPRRTPQIAHT